MAETFPILTSLDEVCGSRKEHVMEGDLICSLTAARAGSNQPLGLGAGLSGKLL